MLFFVAALPQDKCSRFLLQIHFANKMFALVFFKRKDTLSKGLMGFLVHPPLILSRANQLESLTGKTNDN